MYWNTQGELWIEGSVPGDAGDERRLLTGVYLTASSSVTKRPFASTYPGHWECGAALPVDKWQYDVSAIRDKPPPHKTLCQRILEVYDTLLSTIRKRYGHIRKFGLKRFLA